MIKTERHLSRRLTVYDGTESTQYHLCVVTLTIDDGRITDFNIDPFTEESEGVAYHDNPLQLFYGEDEWVFFESEK